jgi:hypothetical protein
MKVYLVKLRNTNVRWFDSESELTKFLTDVSENIKDYIVTTIDATPESQMSGDKILKSIKEQIKIDSKINIVLGDDYSAKVQKFIEMFKELAPKSPFDVDKMRLSAVKVLDQLQSTQPTKEQFSKVVKKNSEYILYNVSNSVEWYKSVLDVYGFKKLAETCQTETINSVTKGSLWRGHRTPEIMIKNFEKAKTSIK